MLDSVGGGGTASTQSQVRRDPPAPANDTSVRPEIAGGKPHEHQALAERAARGRPVEAGNALRTLDEHNGGDRSSTDAQVRTATETTVENGTRTTTATTTRSVSSPDAVERWTSETKTETETSGTSASRKRTESRTHTTREYDEQGNLRIDPATGKPVETVQSKSERSTSVSADGGGVSAGTSASGQRGSAGGSVSGKTTVSDEGVASQGTVKGNVGGVSANGTGGVAFGPDGVTVNGGVGINAGPIGAEHSVEYEKGEDSSKLTSTTSVTLEGGEGKPVSGSVEYQQTNVEELKTNEDGSVTYQVTGESKLTLEAGVDAKQVKVDASWLSGQRTVHTVTVPKGTDVATIDPNNPAAWPEGTRVMISSEDYQGSTLGVSYRNFGVEAGSEVRDGTAIVMEKKADDTVSVSTGPTSGFTTSGKLKVDIGAGIGAELGGENKTDFTFYKSFDIDLAADGGQQTFNDVLTGRQAPTADANGVSNLMDVTTGTWNYTGSAQITTPLGDFGPEHQEGSNTVWKTFADGHIEYQRTYDANGDGKPEVTTVTRSADGTTFDEPSYTFHIPITNEMEAHNGAQFAADPDLKVGDMVEVTLSESELQDMRQKDMSFNTLNETETPETERRMVSAFAEYIGRSGNSEAMMEKLFSLHTSPDYGDYTSPVPEVDLDHPLPGLVTVNGQQP